MIKAVIFDLDGTLLNRDASVRKFIDDQYERLNKWLGYITKEKYSARFIELDDRGYVWKDKVYKQLIAEFNINNITWENLLQDYVEEFKYNCVPFPNLISTLGIFKSKSMRLAMITNGLGQFQMDNIRALGIENYFDTILISETEGIKKPNPEIFKRALEQLNVSPKESVYIGDHLENDVKAAQKVGMKGIWKKDIHDTNVEADFIVDNLNEIPLVIDELNCD